MKIKLKDIEANPYRKIDKYPIDEEKVKALMNSINEKTFWDNILVRPHPDKKDKYQLAYGHHRFIALKKLDYKEIDIPCRDIEDAAMIQIMAEENLNWSTAPVIMTQTILSAKEFLDKELAKYESWERIRSEHMFRPIFKTEPEFRSAKGKGVGRGTLVKFLGGNWTDRRVETALQIIKDKNLDEEAIRTIPTMEQAHVFRTEVKRYDIPKKTQQKIAKTIKEEGIGKRDIPAEVEKHALPIPDLGEKKKKKEFSIPNIAEYILQMESKARDLKHRYERIIPEIGELMKKGRLMVRLIKESQELSEILKGFYDECEKSHSENGSKTKKVASMEVLD